MAFQTPLTCRRPDEECLQVGAGSDDVFRGSLGLLGIPVAVLRGDDLDVGGTLASSSSKPAVRCWALSAPVRPAMMATLPDSPPILTYLGSFHDAGFLLAEQDLCRSCR